MALASRLALAGVLACAVAACGQSDQEPKPETAPAPEQPAPPVEPAAAAPAPAPAVEVAQDEAAGNRPGARVWQLYCVECHAPGDAHPGSAMLTHKKGAEQGVILGRQDLSAEYITTTVRNGMLEMSPFRPTEITDEELTALAEYVRTTTPDAAIKDIDG